jgi:hypothetical protein
MTSHSVWIGVGGNAAIPQGGATQVPVVGEHANEAFGWGHQFQLGTNLNDTTLQGAINNSHVFHFAPSIPSAISNLENDSDYSRAKILGVGIQAVFTNARLVWLDVWDRNNRIFTTTPEDASGNRLADWAMSLSGDLSNVWNEGHWNWLSDSDSYLREDNVIMFPSAPALPQQTILGSVGVSVGVIPLGSPAEGGQNAGGGGSVLFTYLGVYLGFDELERFVNPKVAPPSVTK